MSTPARILIVDDDPIVLRSLVELLRIEGHDVCSAPGLGEALEIIASKPLDLVFADMYLGDETGFTLLEQVKRTHPRLEVVLMTGYGSIEDAMQAVRSGAANYVTKPLIDSEIRLLVDRTLQRNELEEETEALRAAARDEFGLNRIVSKAPEMAKVVRLIRTIANARTTVLLTGESGTGKTLLARAMHFNSARANGPFVEVSCGALAGSLLESELFGHEAGSFTGAGRLRKGKFEAADGGTIFLDEIATASPALQVKLLRVIQDGCFERVGGTETLRSDVRIVLATNVDLTREVRAGRFREDLYYRINVMPVRVPPLRARPADIPLLADCFVRKYAAELEKAVSGIEPDALDALSAYDWPGNVRELENVIERGVVLARGETIAFCDLPAEVARCATSPLQAARADAILSLKQALAEPERQIIRRALTYAHGNRDEAARLLGINRSTLFYKLRKLGMRGIKVKA